MTKKSNVNVWEKAMYIFVVLTIISLIAMITLFQVPGYVRAAYYAIYSMQVSILMLILSISKVE